MACGERNRRIPFASLLPFVPPVVDAVGVTEIKVSDWRHFQLGEGMSNSDREHRNPPNTDRETVVTKDLQNPRIL
jgi:hypothetical protein